MAAAARARAMRAEGIDVISLTLGEPDFPTPPHIIEAAHAAALAGQTKYPPVDGAAALKLAVQRKFRRDSGLDYALDEIIVGNGARQVIFDALVATVDPGDEVIVPAPYWNAYPLVTALAGGTPVFVDCPQERGFRPPPEALARAITLRTKWVVLNFPNNPTGAACSAADLAELAEVLRPHDHVWIMCDDMYEHLIQEGGPHATMAAVAPWLRDRVLTVSGVSKTYAMTGWRVGFAGGPRALIRGMANIQGQATGGVCSVAQAAAVAALDGPQDCVAEMRAAYRRRRDLVVEALNACPGIVCHKPEGAFYVYPNVAGCLGRTSAGGRVLDSDEAVCLALLEEQHVALVHGAAFGMSPHLRLSYAADEATLREACRRIEAFCRGLR